MSPTVMIFNDKYYRKTTGISLMRLRLSEESSEIDRLMVHLDLLIHIKLTFGTAL